MATTGQPPIDLERLLTLDEVSTYLGIPVNTLYAWRTQSKGPRAIKVGKHLRYRRGDVESWLDSQYDDAVGA